MTHTTSTAFPPTPDRSQTVTPTDTTSKLTATALEHAPASYSTLTPLSATNLTITRTTSPFPVPAPNSPALWSQKCHTDHMLMCPWNATTGWSNPTIVPFGPLSLSPMSSALHYATECFEGMKAYRGHDGKLRLFRPQRNCERMLKSATRIALPGFDPNELQKCIGSFVRLEATRWLPKEQEGSYLYLRPTMIGTGDALGVQTPTEALLFLVAVCFPPLDEPHKATLPPTTPALQSLPSTTGAPVGSTTTQPPQGMRLLASRHDMVRAWPGGFGNAKLGANYGPSFIAQQEAREKGYNQILWLFGEQGYVTEAGASNFFVLWKTRAQQGDGEGRLQLITAPLGDGVILEGVTRASVLDLARTRWAGEVDVVERNFMMAEIVEAAEEGRLIEAFGCGTAFFIAPIVEIHFRGRDVELPLKRGVEAAYALAIKGWLKEIMFGRVEHEWGVVVEE
jgi:branched-chain amino acid aminotransferase